MLFYLRREGYEYTYINIDFFVVVFFKKDILKKIQMLNYVER